MWHFVHLKGISLQMLTVFYGKIHYHGHGTFAGYILELIFRTPCWSQRGLGPELIAIIIEICCDCWTQLAKFEFWADFTWVNPGLLSLVGNKPFHSIRLNPLFYLHQVTLNNSQFCKMDAIPTLLCGVECWVAKRRELASTYPKMLMLGCVDLQEQWTKKIRDIEY